LHKSRSTQNNIPFRKRFTNTLAKQNNQASRNRSKPNITKKWIDDSLSKKLLVRETVFYLGTAYDSTRIHDVRQDNILREIPNQEEV
jgi:hypothetical protein